MNSKTWYSKQKHNNAKRKDTMEINTKTKPKLTIGEDEWRKKCLILLVNE